MDILELKTLLLNKDLEITPSINKTENNPFLVLNGWKKSFTNDPDIFTNLVSDFKNQRKKNYNSFCIKTGNKIIALDIDINHGNEKNGFKSLENLKKDLGLNNGEFDTFNYSTKSGGKHFLFGCDNSSNIKTGNLNKYEGIEIKGDNGTINCDYEITKNSLKDIEIKKLPKKLETLLFIKDKKQPKKNVKNKDNSKNSVNIKDLYSQYFKLKNGYIPEYTELKNGEINTHCCFHADINNPNMDINLEKKVFYCNNCKENGGTFKLEKLIIEEIKNDISIEFLELKKKDLDNLQIKSLLENKYGQYHGFIKIINTLISNKNTFIKNWLDRYIMIKSPFCILDKISGELVPENQLYRYYNNKAYETIDSDGHKINLFKDTIYNFKKPNRYEGIDYHPSKKAYETIIDDGVRKLNLFSGFIEPIKGNNHKKFLTFIKEIICNDDIEKYDFVINWIRKLFQEPERKELSKVLVLEGTQGVGKTFFFQHLGFLLNKNFEFIVNWEKLENFNSIMANKLLLVFQEAIFSYSGKSNDILKSWISDTTINLSQKFISDTTIKNFLHFGITTNKEFSAPVEDSDRRYVCLRVNNKEKNNKTYFGDIVKDLVNGGYNHLLFYMQNSKFDANKLELKTKENFKNTEIWLKNNKPVIAFLIEAVKEDLEFYKKGVISVSDFNQEFKSFCENEGLKFRHPRTYLEGVYGPNLYTRKTINSMQFQSIDFKNSLHFKTKLEEYLDYKIV